MNTTHTRRPFALALAAGLLAALLIPPTTAAAASTDGMTTTSITGGIKISKVLFDPAGNELHAPNGEKVYIKNVSRRTKNLQGVVLSDDDGHRYTLPYYRLSPGNTVTIRSGSGTRRYGTLYAGWPTSVWNNDGDVARLRAANGTWIDKCRWSGSGTTAYC